MYQIITEGENRCWLALELLGAIAAAYCMGLCYIAYTRIVVENSGRIQPTTIYQV